MQRKAQHQCDESNVDGATAAAVADDVGGGEVVGVSGPVHQVNVLFEQTRLSQV